MLEKTEKQNQSNDPSKMSFALTAAEATINSLKETISSLYANRFSLIEFICLNNLINLHLLKYFQLFQKFFRGRNI